MMKGPRECRKHAEECRSLAKHGSDDQRQQASEMADLWERLARDRERGKLGSSSSHSDVGQ